MADVLHSVLAAAFVLGMIVSALLLLVVVHCCGAFQSRQAEVKQAKAFEYPSEIYVSRAGRSYHLRKTCCIKDTLLSSMKLCQHCAKHGACAHLAD